MSYTDFPKTKNDYFNFDTDYTADKRLYKLLLTEAYNKHGNCLTYYVSTYDTTYDQIYGEDVNRHYTRYFSIMGYYQLPVEDEMWTQYGIEGMDNFKVFVSKRHFETASRDNNTADSYIPKVGDILKASYNGIIYEIIDVGEEEEMFLREKHTWEFTVRPFRDNNVSLSGDTVDTILSAYTDQATDMFDVSAVVAEEKDEFLYNAPSTEESIDDIWGEW